MANLTASIPHQLTRAEAKRRIREGIDSLRKQQGSILDALRETWTDDRIDFTAGVMGQSVSGRLAVDDHHVHVDIALPWFLKMFAGTITHRVENDIRQILHAPQASDAGR